jgi:hypothetical protein
VQSQESWFWVIGKVVNGQRVIDLPRFFVLTASAFSSVLRSNIDVVSSRVTVKMPSVKVFFLLRRLLLFALPQVTLTLRKTNIGYCRRHSMVCAAAPVTGMRKSTQFSA